jgi:hypothetical protein
VGAGLVGLLGWWVLDCLVGAGLVGAGLVCWLVGAGFVGVVLWVVGASWWVLGCLVGAGFVGAGSLGAGRCSRGAGAGLYGLDVEF